MATFINNLAPGKIALVGVMDEASYRLNDNAKNALRLIGQSSSFTLGYREGYALIGAKHNFNAIGNVGPVG